MSRISNEYREDLENPPLLVVCDLELFEIHTNFTGTAKQVYRFSLDDLLKNQATADCKLPPIEVLRAVFTDPARHSRGYSLRLRYLLIPILDPGADVLEVLDVALEHHWAQDEEGVSPDLLAEPVEDALIPWMLLEELGDRIGVE
jgi:hypothetical protein